MSKPPKLYQEQLAIFESRGLRIQAEPFALHCLAHHNYYRLSAYRFPFTMPGNPDQFTPGATFEQIWDLYCFDRGLRQLLLEAGKQIEISVRSRLAYEIGHRLGPLSYLEKKHFRDSQIHARTLTKLDEEMRRSQEAFIKHHQTNLAMPWPPIWVAIEVASFGVISSLLDQLEPPFLRQAIADTYQLDERTFCSLFHHLCVLRNTAAHHNRIWNRKFVVTFQLPRKKPAHLWTNFYTHPQHGIGRERKLYNTLVLLVYLLLIIEPQTTWPQRLLQHLQSLDSALTPDMGFPEYWQSRPIWKGILPRGGER
jgi:abortive infection bacteriophage resistance protein